MKYFPNGLSIMRILFSFSLFLLSPSSLNFWTVYFICGITDILDGYIARRYHAMSKHGEVLDTVGDIVMIFVIGVMLLPLLTLSIGVWSAIILIAAIRFAAMLIGFYKFRVLTTVHTYGNKLTGFLLFIYLPLVYFDSHSIGMIVVIVIAMLSAIEELLLQLTLKEVSRNRKSLFIR